MAPKQYTLAEVGEHRAAASLWVVIHDRVYDVTRFQHEHPGGEEALLEVAGRDGSAAFEDAQHSSDARAMLADYLVGEVVEAERKAKKNDKWQFCARCVVLPIVVGITCAVLYRVYFRSRGFSTT